MLVLPRSFVFVADLGYSVGLPIDLSVSGEFNLQQVHVASWILWLTSERLILGFMVEPPCTTFSVMRRPALRDAELPFGFDVQDEQTIVGNTLGQRGFQMLATDHRSGVAGLLETPNSFKLKNMPSWKALCAKPNVFSTRCDSCRYGSIHLKSFKFLRVGFQPTHACFRCCALAPTFLCRAPILRRLQLTPICLHRLLLKILLMFLSPWSWLPLSLTAPSRRAWKINLSMRWPFPATGRSNPLEPSKSLLTSTSWNWNHLVPVWSMIWSDKMQADRFVAFVDSIVTRGSVAKGRSSSLAVAALLRQICSLCVVGGLHAVAPFVPTRLNVADDHTRDREPRPPCEGLDASWDKPMLFPLARLPPLSRWGSNWVRLVLLLVGPTRLLPFDRSQLRKPQFDFDSTLGFPGEGPPIFVVFALSFPASAFSFSCCLPSWAVVPVFCLLVSGLLVCPCRVRGLAMALRLVRGTTLTDWEPLQRHTLGPLPTGRQVLPVTQSNRESFLQSFCGWCRSQQLDIEVLFDHCWENVEDINRILVAYGWALYAAGRPHSHYIECINAVAGHRPILKRHLQEAWDLGFHGWGRSLPPTMWQPLFKFVWQWL